MNTVSLPAADVKYVMHQQAFMPCMEAARHALLLQAWLSRGVTGSKLGTAVSRACTVSHALVQLPLCLSHAKADIAIDIERCSQ